MLATMINYGTKIDKFDFCVSQVSKKDLLYFSSYGTLSTQLTWI